MLVRSDATVQQRYWTVSLATDLDNIRRGMKIEVLFISYKNRRTNNIYLKNKTTQQLNANEL